MFRGEAGWGLAHVFVLLKADAMAKIEVGFQPHPFEKTMVEQTRQHIQDRLAGHQFGLFKIVLKKPPGSQEISFQFLGDPESCEKARRLLGIY
jgi:hypothetical protein